MLLGQDGVSAELACVVNSSLIRRNNSPSSSLGTQCRVSPKFPLRVAASEVPHGWSCAAATTRS